MSARFLFAFFLLVCGAAKAHEYKAGDIRVAHPHASASMPGQPAGAVYIGLENAGPTADRLIGASTAMAKSVELHTMSTDNNVMRMREVTAIEIPSGANIVMQPGGGYHIMLLNLKKPLVAGEKFPLTLVFEKAGPLEVSIVVEATRPKAVMSGEAEHKH